MTTKDEDEIYKENDSFMEAWNQGNARLAASFFADDAVRVSAMGDIEQGRDEIEKAYHTNAYDDAGRKRQNGKRNYSNAN